MLTSAWWIFHGRVDLWIDHDHVEVRSPVMIAEGDELISCVVGDCDELTMAFCQSLVFQNDDGGNGIVVSDEMVVREKVEIGGGGDRLGCNGAVIAGGGCGVW